MIGKTVGQYRVTEKLGAGGMGEVYLAEDTKLHRKVALKFLPERLSSDPDFKSRFEHEARAAAALNHPNIITVHDLGEHEGRLYIVMEHVAGRTLGELIAEAPPSVDKALDLVTQIADGLAAAHEAGIVHRDIKPANILLTKDTRVKILDFGLAKSHRATTETRVGSTLGTVQYESPEQSRGEEVDQRSDIFSLGVVFYELITGRLPFAGEYDEAIRYAISHEPAEPLARYKAGVTPELESLVGRMLEKDPDMRHQSARGVISDIKRLRRDSNPIRSSEIKPAPAPASDTPSMVVPPSKVTPVAGETQTRKRSVLIPASVVIALIIAALVFKPWKFEVSPTQEAQASEDMLAIMYFDNLKEPSDPEQLGEMSTNLLITALSDNQDIRVLSSQRLYDILKQLGKADSKVIDRETASQVAQRANARWMLTGTILQTDPRLVITTQVIDVTTGEVHSSQRSTAEEGEDIFAQLDRLTAEIRKDMSLGAGGSGQSHNLASMTTSSPEAYRYFLQGIDYVMQMLSYEAAEKFEQAIALDSTFAMAYCWLSFMGENSEENIRKALKHSSQLSDLDRRYVLAESDRRSGHSHEAIDALHEILRDHPDEKIATRLIADIYSGRLSNADSNLYYNLKTLEIDPTFKLSINDIAYRYKDRRDFDKALEYINRYVEMAPDEPNPYDSRGEILLAAGRVDEAAADFKRALTFYPGFRNSLFALSLIEIERGNFAAAEEWISQLINSKWSEDRPLGRTLRGELAVRAGKFVDALRFYEQGLSADLMEGFTGWEAHDKIWLQARALVEMDRFDEAHTVCQQLIDAGLNQRDDQVSAYVETKIEILIQEGQVDRARELLSSHKGRLFDRASRGIQARFHLTSARVEFADGRFDQALSELDSAGHKNPRNIRIFAEGFRGEVHLAAGKPKLAIEPLKLSAERIESFAWRNQLFAVKNYYYLARAYEEVGDRQNAIATYEKFLDIWGNADVELECIRDARARLKSLSS